YTQAIGSARALLTTWDGAAGVAAVATNASDATTTLTTGTSAPTTGPGCVALAVAGWTAPSPLPAAVAPDAASPASGWVERARMAVATPAQLALAVHGGAPAGTAYTGAWTLPTAVAGGGVVLVLRPGVGATTLTPDGIAPSVTLGAPALAPGPTTLAPDGIVPRARVGAPALATG